MTTRKPVSTPLGSPVTVPLDLPEKATCLNEPGLGRIARLEAVALEVLAVRAAIAVPVHRAVLVAHRDRERLGRGQTFVVHRLGAHREAERHHRGLDLAGGSEATVTSACLALTWTMPRRASSILSHRLRGRSRRLKER